MITPTPLEKQLVNIDLTKGQDERQRPETMGGITKLENLVCDQTGSWVKRDGTYIGPLEDASGSSTYPSYVKKVLPFLNGWGCIADNGYLLHKQDQQNTFRRRQQHMDFAVISAAYSGSSGPSVQSTSSGANVSTVASGTYHDAYVMKRNTFSSSTTSFKLTVVERSTGVEYSYDFSKITWAVSPGNNIVNAVFVGGRYLHVYSTSGLGATQQNLQLIVIDTGAAMPANETVIVPIVVNAGTCSLSDAHAGATYSYVLFFDSAAVAYRLYNYDATGTLTATAVVQSGATALTLNETTGEVWTLAASAASANLASWSSSTLAGNISPYATGKPGSYISSDSLTNEMYMVYTPAINAGATFGTNTIPELRVSTIATPGAAAVYKGAMYGWRVVANPFFVSTTGKHYIHMVKADVESSATVSLTTVGEIASNVLCDLSTFTQFYSNTAALALPYGSFRLACVLEPYFGLARLGSSTGVAPWRYQTRDGSEVSICVPYQTFRATTGIGFYRAAIAYAPAYAACNFGGATHIAHGGINSYDGRNLVECSLADMPVAKLSVTAGAGNLNGSYRYYLVYRHTDANGAAAMGRVYGPLSSVNASAGMGRNDFVIQPHGITNRDTGRADSVPVVDVYRSKSGGTQFYLVASSQELGFFGGTTLPNVTSVQANTTTGLLTFQDNISDTLLGSNPVMYRQPGTPNAAADRYPAPACSVVVQHKDRLFCVDPYGQRVFYSSFFVDGECPWFNPAFNFFVHAGAGPITALASMDGRLFIFKRDQVFVVDGDGPGESGPTGNEFSPPQALASRYGCVDHRSVVVTPAGIMYRSTRGIEMLTRNLKVEWIGERVQNTVDANQYTTGVAMGPDARVHWTLAADKNNANGLYYVTGVEIVYDTSADAWSVIKSSGYTGVYGHARQSIAFVQEPLGSVGTGAPTETMVYADGYIGTWIQDFTNSNDFSTVFTPFTVETGWIKQGMLARQRVSDLLFLAKKRAGSNHAVKLSIAYDYSDTYTQTHTFQPNEIVSTVIEEIELQPSKQQVLAIRFKIEDQAPTDTATYPIGTGKGSDVLGIVAEVAPKLGSPKLSTAQKA